MKLKIRHHDIFLIALPLILSSLSNFFFQIADAAILAPYGKNYLAAAALGGSYDFFFLSLLLGMSLGIQYLMSRNSETQPLEARKILERGFWIFLIISFLVSILALTFYSSWLRIQNTEVDLSNLCRSYFFPLSINLIPYGLNRLFVAYFVAIKKTRVILWTTLTTQALNIVLAFILVRGIGGFAGWGIAGSSTANLVVTILELSIYMFILRFKAAPLKSSLSDLHFVRDFISKAWSPGANQVSFSIYWNILHMIVNSLGASALSVFSIFLKLSLVPTYIFFGIGTAAGSLSASQLTQKNLGEFRNIGILAMTQSLILLIIIFVFSLPILPSVINYYFQDEETRQLAIKSLFFFIFYLLFDAFNLTLQRLLISAGSGQSVFKKNLRNQILFGVTCSFIGVKFMGQGLMTVWIAQGLYRAANALDLFLVWRKIHNERISGRSEPTLSSL